MSRLRSNSAISEEDGDQSGPHPVEPRSRVAILPPVLTKAVDADPLCWLEFTEDSIMTSCKSGALRDPIRPPLSLCSSQLTTMSIRSYTDVEPPNRLSRASWRDN